MNLREFPAGWFSAVMGLAGLALAARAAAPALPGLVPAPAYFTEPWLLLALLAFLLLLPLYLGKLLRHPAAVAAELRHPALLGFCGTLPVGMTLLAAGLAPYSAAVANALWWPSAALILLLQAWALARWLAGPIELADVNGGWLVGFVGGVVAPAGGLALGHDEAVRVLFGVSAAGAPLLVALIFYRAVVAPPLPEPLRPTLFVLLVPPSLIYANGSALYGEGPALESLFFAALVLGGALLWYARGFLRWKFGPAWWAFTFPLDALAYAAARYAQSHPTPLWRAVCAATLLAATAFVLAVLWRTLRNAASRPA